MGERGRPAGPGDPGGSRPVVVVSSADAGLLGRMVAEVRAAVPGARVVGVLGPPELGGPVVDDLTPGGPARLSDGTGEGR